MSEKVVEAIKAREAARAKERAPKAEAPKAPAADAPKADAPA